MLLLPRRIGRSEEKSTFDFEKTITFDFFALKVRPRLVQYLALISISFSSAEHVGAKRQMSSAKRMMARNSLYM